MRTGKSSDSAIEWPLSYSLRLPGKTEISGGEASAVVSETEFALLPVAGSAITLCLRDIKHIVQGDYKIVLSLYSGDSIILSHLGYRFEDFLRTIRRFHNELRLKDMLMEETLIQAGLEATVAKSQAPAEGHESEVRLYQTALVIIPQQGRPARIPYG
ncbi:MAG TPA: hypothetical protein GX529_05455, partial [Firmicutes bacterium]|nr:hypothetical protein [Candidatus Fermentithermobacillaceae bacterium]